MLRMLAVILLAVVFMATRTEAQIDEAKIRGIIGKFDKESLGLQVMMFDRKIPGTVEAMVDLLRTHPQYFPEVNVSTACQKDIRIWWQDLIMSPPKQYALEMVDAWGKPPAGIMLGHILVFGHFDQCMSQAPFANYCLTRIKNAALEKRLPALPAYGLCVPSGCANHEDIRAYVAGFLNPLESIGVLDPEKRAISLVKTVCVSPLPKTIGFFVMIVIIAVIFLAVIAACVVDCYYRRRYKQVNNGDINGTDDLDGNMQFYESSKTTSGNGTVIKHQEAHRKVKYGYANVPPFLKPFLCFHFMTNLRSIFSTSSDGEIAFLHGFRVLSMWWIILGHTYHLGMNFFENRVTLYHHVSGSLGYQIILNAGYAVDGFFMVGGLLITYVIYWELVKNDGRLNWVLVYFHRWWRLTPVYMFVMLFYVFVLPYGIQSPWKLLIMQEGAPTEYCKSHWWSNIFYFNNFFPVYKNLQCMNWTWFLALDMQFFVLAPLLVFILYKSRVAGFALIAVIVAACVATTMSLIGVFGLPLHFQQDPILTADNVSLVEKNVDYIYEKPYTRITPFVIGVALGYLFVKVPSYKPSGIKKLIVGLAGWVLATAIAIPLLFGYYFAGGYETVMPMKQDMGLTARIIYGGLQRLGWSLVLGWILVACNYGYGGFVYRFLALRFWRPFSNLTYGAYLVHLLTLQLYFASQRHMIYYSPLNMVAIFVFQLVLAYGVALFFALFVEVPLLRLERLVVRKSL